MTTAQIMKRIKNKLPWLSSEDFKVSKIGTHHRVACSKNYVIRIRNSTPQILTREAKLLNKLNHPLIPKSVWVGKVAGVVAQVERRLPGLPIDKKWKTLPTSTQNRIVRQLAKFFYFLRSNNFPFTYSVETGKKYKNFAQYLGQRVNKQMRHAKKHVVAKELLFEIFSTLNTHGVEKIFNGKPIAVHGDLINHNLLTDGNTLTGVVDFELALYGDTDYDVCRLLYYQECALAYSDNGQDKYREVEFLSRVVSACKKARLIKSSRLFADKYRYLRATFFLNALVWAVNSKNPKANIDELNNLWHKKRARRRSA